MPPQDQRQQCQYSTAKRTRSNSSVKELNSLRDRLSRLESLLPNSLKQLPSPVDQAEDFTIVVVDPNLDPTVNPSEPSSRAMDQHASEQEIGRAPERAALLLHEQDVTEPVGSPPTIPGPIIDVPVVLPPTTSRPHVAYFPLPELTTPDLRLTPSPTCAPDQGGDPGSNTFLLEDEVSQMHIGPANLQLISHSSLS